MELFIGNIPKDVTSYELRRFVNGIFEQNRKGMLFWRKKMPDSMSFKIIEKQTASEIYHYAIATISPLEVAEECIELLDKQFFRGEPLEVREYVRRSYMNERRAVNWRNIPWEGEERRMGDRRQNALSSNVPVMGEPQLAPA